MKAKDFIEKFGWSLACRDIAALDSGFIKSEDFLEHYGFEIPSNLKQYTEAYELVNKFGGLGAAKGEYFEIVHSGKYKDVSPVYLSKAIQLVESIEVKNV